MEGTESSIVQVESGEETRTGHRDGRRRAFFGCCEQSATVTFVNITWKQCGSEEPIVGARRRATHDLVLVNEAAKG